VPGLKFIFMKKLIIIFLTILALAFFVFKAKADTAIFIDFFEGYSLGNLEGQGGWHNLYGGSILVSDTQSETPSNSVKGQASGYAFSGVEYTGTTEIGYIEFSFYDTNGSNHMLVGLNDGTSAFGLNAQIGDCATGGAHHLCYSGNSSTLVIDYTTNAWPVGRLYFNLNTEVIGLSVDGGAIQNSDETGLTTADITHLFLETNSVNSVYIDNLILYDTSAPPWTQLGITDPVSGQPIPTGNYLFQGYCGTNGTDEIALTDNTFEPTLTNFNIDCVDYGWTATSSILYGPNQKNAFDLAWLDGSSATTTDFVIYNGTSATTTSQLCADSGWWCELGYYLFVPPQSVFNAYNNDVLIPMKTKIPFVYFFDMYDLLATTTVASTTDDYLLTIKPKVMGQELELNILSLDPNSDVIKWAIALRGWILGAIWISFGIGAFFTIRSIHL